MKLDKNEIVISGVGGYFPNCENLEQLQTALLNNEILLSSRWREGEHGVTNRIGTCPSIEYFDTAFFGIHRQQSTFMDPMQRIVLERTFEALIDAGVNPLDIRGKRVGCFLGSSIGENDNLFYESIVSGFGVTGHSRAMMPNRVSYWLNLKGPSCAYDSNWLNGFEVLKLAFDAVRDGHCESAIIGTANLSLNSELSWLYNDMGVLSSDGSTKAFTADASGYARSDGIVIMYIQRACDAKRAYATVVNVATQFNGNRDGTFLDVDQLCMEKFMRSFYAECNIDPATVGMVECYGSAQKNIDEAELNAIDNVYCQNRDKPLLIGSVKTNTGHSEASAAMFSLAKVLITMETETVPATLQYTSPNPNIPGLTNGHLEVVTKNVKWEGGLVAVNGIGISSSYGHVLLKSSTRKKNLDVVDGLPRLAIGSTRTESGIKDLLKTIAEKKELDPEYISLIQQLFSKPIQGHLYRGYTILNKGVEIKQEFEHHAGNKRQIWFCYSGMGSQWLGMARDLLELPIFKESLMKCHNVLLPKGIDLIQIVTSDDKTIFDNILHSFVGIAAVQIALTDILRAMGVTPDGIIGHSVGELGCAYADNCLTAEQMILCAYSRGRASLEADLIPGMMAAIGLGYDQMKDQVTPSIEVACHNGPDSSTISGPTADMEIFVKNLQDKGVFARLVNVSNIAYHSRYIKPAAPGLLNYLKEVIPVPVPRSSKWISTSNPEGNWDTDLAKTSSAEYHTNNLLSAVLFEEGSRHIPKDSVVIEIAPHGLLQAILKRSLKSGCTNIPLTQRGTKNGLEFLLGAIGKMYLAGLDIDVSLIYPKIEYPVSRGTCGLAPLVHWEHGEKWRTGLEDKLNYLVSVENIELSLTSEQYRVCEGHILDHRVVLPMSQYMINLMRILKASISKDITTVIFENIKIDNIITLPKMGTVPFYAMVQKGSGNFEVLSGEQKIMTGRVFIPENDKFFISTNDLDNMQEAAVLTSSDIYNEFSHRGCKYSKTFKMLKKMEITDEGSICTMSANGNWQDYLEGMLQQFFFQQGERSQQIIVPNKIQNILINMSMLNSDEEDVQSTYNLATGIISMKGLQIIGAKSTILPSKPKAISFDSLEFINLKNQICENIESVINYSMHIVINNFAKKFAKNVSITEICSNNGESLFNSIENVKSKYSELAVNMFTIVDPKCLIISQNEPYLIIYNNNLTEEIVKLMIDTDIYVLVKSGKSILNYTDIIEVAKFTLKDLSYSLLRKVHLEYPKVVHIKSDTISSMDLNKNSSWVVELNNLASTLKETENIFLISSVVPIEGITNFVDELKNNEHLQFVKLIFALDEKVQDFNSSREFYKHLFKSNNSLTIIKDGIIGTFLPNPIEFKTNAKINLQLSSNVLDDLTLTYFGINRNDECITEKTCDNALGSVDYSGYNTLKERFMGVAKFNAETCSLETDPLFKWEVPEDWGLEDGCSVPHAYATAYYALLVKGKLNVGETILIHNGCSPIGLAAISIASTSNCSVYTTVSSEYQKAFLKKQFHTLRDRNILSSESTSFEPLVLLATGGNGANVIINSLSDNLLHASLRCIADFGRFIQIGKYDIKANNSIGMSLFLRNTSMIGINPDHLLECPAEEKQLIHDLLEEGLQKFVVRPLFRKVVEHQDIAVILGNLNLKSNIGKILIKLSNEFPLQQFNIDKINRFICDGKASHLIYGGTSEQWTDMAEWLVIRGARRIAITSESKPQQNHINRRLTLLQLHYGTEIIYTPVKVHTKDSALELLSEVYFLGPIHSVFVLPTSHTQANNSRRSDIKSVYYLDMALRTTAPKALFVNMMAEAVGISAQRANTTFATYNVQWSSDMELADVLHGLDDILTFKVKSIIIKDDQRGEIEQDNIQSFYKKLSLILPSSSKELIQQYVFAPKKLELIQLSSAGSRVIREVPPVFIIPGLSGQELVKNSAKNLLNPIFYANIPYNFIPIKEAAEFFAEEIKKIYPRGPYNIIGISFGGAISIEIAKILQKSRTTQLTLIDGAIDTIQSSFKYLGDGLIGEISLLTRILHINSGATVKKLETCKDWKERVTYSLKSANVQVDDLAVLTQALNTLKKKIEEVLEYRNDGEMVKGAVHLIRPTGSNKYDNCGLMKYVEQYPKVFVMNGDHLSILSDYETIDTLNENVTVI